MKNAAQRLSRTRPGVSLIETVLAVGVLAVAVPLGLAAMVKAGESANDARSETRAPAIAERCLAELCAARRGLSPHFPELARGMDFPGGDEVLALAFARDGRLLGALESDGYALGVDEIDDAAVDYVAVVSGRLEENAVTVTVAVEHPAIRPAGDRDAVTFHTRLP